MTTKRIVHLALAARAYVEEDIETHRNIDLRSALLGIQWLAILLDEEFAEVEAQLQEMWPELIPPRLFDIVKPKNVLTAEIVSVYPDGEGANWYVLGFENGNMIPYREWEFEKVA